VCKTGLLVFVFCNVLIATDAEVRWRELNRVAREAIEGKDYAKLREVLLQLRPLVPGNPRVAYNLAAAEAVLGHREAALAAVRDLANMGRDYNLSADPDFESIRQTSVFRAAVQRIEISRRAVSHSTPFASIATPDLIAEDLAYDPRSGRYFVSSVRRGMILTPDGREFAHADWSILALHADPPRRLLWATTAWLPHCDRCVPADKDKTALLAFDLDSGALKQRIDSPVPGVLGDLTVSSTGEVFVCEGLHGAVFRLRPGSNQLERLDPPDEFPSPQTPALSADEGTLYVPDYARGIAAIRLADRHVEWLQPAAGIALTGIDGLYLHAGRFLAIQNGTNPKRVMRFSLDLREQELLEAHNSYLGEPTHGVFVGDDFYFIANSGWSEYGEDGKKKPGAPAVTSTIRKLQ
jgi:hypothetical protein